MIKMIIAPLLFSTLVVGIAGTGDLKAMGRIGLKAIIYFEVATTIALFLGLALVNIFKPGAAARACRSAPTPRPRRRWRRTSSTPGTSSCTCSRPRSSTAMARGDILQVVVFSTFFGIAARGDRRRRGSRCSTCSRAPRR